LATAPSLRVLALVTDAFGGHGGIAQYNRDFLTSLAGCDSVAEVIVLPRAAAESADEMPTNLHQFRPIKAKLLYSLYAMRLALTQKFDLVYCGHVFMAPLAAAATKILRSKLWIQVYGIDVWQELPTLYQRSLRVADLVTSLSRFTTQRLLQWAPIDSDRVKVLPCTVNKRFQPGPKPPQFVARHRTENKKVLLTVSRLASTERYKGHDRVIRSLPRVMLEVPNVIYLIAGDGDDRARLESLSESVGVRSHVEFVGQVKPEELPDYFRLADVFVMPSTGEGFGIVFVEALASGLHVVGGNRDGSLDALGDGKLGWAIDPENEEELARAICAALRDPSDAVQHAARFGTEFFAEHLSKLVDRFIVSADRAQG